VWHVAASLAFSVYGRFNSWQFAGLMTWKAASGYAAARAFGARAFLFSDHLNFAEFMDCNSQYLYKN
jgi:hypothetical protein